MAGQASRVGAQLALDYITGRAVGHTAARNTFLCLLTSAPTDASTFAAVAALEPFAPGVSGYSRPQVTWSAPTAADPTVSQNSGTLTIGPFTADPANVTHCALVSASTGSTGDFLFWWDLATAKDAALNESIQFAAAALTSSMT